MCKILTTDTDGAIEVTCEISGKPITETGVYGMFCEDKCGFADEKKMGDAIMGLFGFTPREPKKGETVMARAARLRKEREEQA
jgi:hypothetical protein